MTTPETKYGRRRVPLFADFSLVGRALRLTFNPEGRSRRTEFALYVFLSSWAAALIGQLAAWFELGSTQDITMLAGLFLVVPLPALTIRRLHDMDCSGWWSFPFVCGYVSALGVNWLDFTSRTQGLPISSDGFEMVKVVTAMVMLIVLGLLTLGPPSQDNRFGSAPGVS
jgi:uncharacterized membrane protein YhaH (DUF805 family)